MLFCKCKQFNTLVAQRKNSDDAVYALELLINIVSSWSKIHHLFRNSTKSKWMLINPSMKRHMVPIATAWSSTPKLSSTELELTYSLRFLGVIHADNLSWKLLLAAVARKVNCMLGVIRCATNVANSNLRLRLFQAFVKLIILCCLPVLLQNISDAISTTIFHYFSKII